MITWHGADVLNEIGRRVDAQMMEIGRKVVQIAQTYSPVRTGALRAGEHFDYNLGTHTLVFVGDAPHDIFVEYGTRYQKPQPHWRPAINTVGQIYGFNLELAFANTPSIKSPILAAGAGFHLPSTLSAKQLAHVRQHLLPTSKRHYISNVSRTTMHMRKY